MPLCSNRPEGFGPHSSIHPNVPTTCFLEVIVVPLASWIYILVALPVLLVLARKSRSATLDGVTKHGEIDQAHKRSLFKRILAWLYYILALCMLAMASLQIARLAVAHLGIGLLPFTLARTAIGAVVFYTLRKRVGMLGRLLGALCWILLVVGMALLVYALRTEEQGYSTGRSQYPLGDEVTDVGTMSGVAVVLAILEIVA